MIRVLAIVLFCAGCLALPANAQNSAVSKPIKLYIGWPNDGETIKSRRFRVWFGLRNMNVAPAGIDAPHSGHHHLLINTPLPPLDERIPSDKTHVHYGAGQTETVLTLPPGKHTLQLLLGDKDHFPHDPPVYSKQITITIEP